MYLAIGVSLVTENLLNLKDEMSDSKRKETVSPNPNPLPRWRSDVTKRLYGVLLWEAGSKDSNARKCLPKVIKKTMFHFTPPNTTSISSY